MGSAFDPDLQKIWLSSFGKEGTLPKLVMVSGPCLDTWLAGGSYGC
jgi:hypothetical protein